MCIVRGTYYTIQDNFRLQIVNFLDVTKSIIFDSGKRCYMVASKYYRNHFISEKYNTVQSVKLQFLQYSPLMRLYTLTDLLSRS
jgi:hypothetical protein